jgi:uncharacterized membrane protein YdbT with pleckstrin-like domain
LKPSSAEERILKYCEHAAQFDVHTYLDSYARQLNFVQQSGLDLLAVLLLVVAFTLYLTYIIAIKLSRLSGQQKQKAQ